MGQFANNTSVSVERTQGEIKGVLTKYGASKTMMGEDNDNGTAVIQFACKERCVKFVLTLPKRSDRQFFYTAHRHQRRSDQQAYEAWEQACRQKWRALLLCIKAKLEAVESGISEFEDEFLSHIVLADGRTVGQVIRPQVAESYLTGLPMQGITALLEHKA